MKEMIEDLVFSVARPPDNARVLYSARQMLSRMGFNLTEQYLIAAAVSELSTNIIHYGKEGTITMKQIIKGRTRGFEVTARDRGPGIADIDRALEENYSTGNGLGLGLPSVRRIMDEMDIASSPGQGTLIIAKKWKH